MKIILIRVRDRPLGTNPYPTLEKRNGKQTWRIDTIQTTAPLRSAESTIVKNCRDLPSLGLHWKKHQTEIVGKTCLEIWDIYIKTIDQIPARG